MVVLMVLAVVLKEAAQREAVGRARAAAVPAAVVMATGGQVMAEVKLGWVAAAVAVVVAAD